VPRPLHQTSREAAPGRPSPRAPRPPPPTPERAELQLAISRTGIGLELTGPLTLGCLTVSELAVSLPSLRFPVDVSGGVTRFRHRRGVIERLVIDVARASLETWAAPRLRGVIGVSTPRVMLFVRRGGATVGVVDEREMRALAFDLELDPDGEDIALCTHSARGFGLLAPATALAVRTVATLAGDLAERKGARFAFPRVGLKLGRVIFPDRGARAPLLDNLPWVTVRGHEDAWLLIGQRGDVPGEPLAPAVVARETCALAELSDDAAFGLDFERARSALVDALERAPRHGALSHRLAEIDRVLGDTGRAKSGRSEAALATLRDAQAAGRSGRAGGDGGSEPILFAELLRDIGDRSGATAAFVRAGEAEPVGPLAAMAFDAASQIAQGSDEALAWLDRAVARAPALPGPRWSRLVARLRMGRVNDAVADAEHLEAMLTGSRARLGVWLRAGETFRREGFEKASAPLFERALRYAPTDPIATAGLGAALVGVGKVARGAELLTQAIELAEKTGTQAWRASLDLAQVLAERLDDKPAAIARAGAVPTHAEEAIRARALEARWRAELGDIAGAAVAFTRARDLIESRATDLAGAHELEAVAILREAARLEGETRGDWLGAQRHLHVALRLAPHDEGTRTAFREAGRHLVATPTALGMPASETGSAPTWTAREPPVPGGTDPGTSPEKSPEEQEAHDHARVEELTRRLHADPANDDVVDELSDCLLRLGRTHELFALLSARLDEAPPGRREALLPTQRLVLQRLEDDALRSGNAEEAALYREAREML